MRVLSVKEVDAVSGGFLFAGLSLKLNLSLSLFDWCKPKACAPVKSCEPTTPTPR